MGTKLYVGSLPFSLTEQELSQIFAPHGNVVSARVIIDKVSGRSKGFGFVEYDSEDSASKAIEVLNNSEVSGRKIIVSEAQPPREGGGNRGGGFRSGGGHRGGGGGGHRGGGFRSGGGRGGNY